MIDGRGEPIVMDFGLARPIQSEAAARLTQSGMLVGSPAYMSPEQVEGDTTKLTPATDQYSLGVMLYELLTGSLPFRGGVAAIVGAILTKEPAPPGQLRTDLDPRIESLCLKMLAKSPGDRLASMGAVADSIATILKTPADPVKRRSRETSSGNGKKSKRTQSQKVAAVAAASITASNVESLLDAARKCMRKYDCEQVVQMLDSLPENKRTDEVRALLAKARELTDEVAFLLAEIDEAARLNDNDALAGKTDALLKLKPKHHKALQIKAELDRYGKGRIWKPGGWTPDGQRIGEGSWIPWLPLSIFAGVFGVTLLAVVLYLRVGDAIVRVQIKHPDVEVGIQNRTLNIKSAQQDIKIDPGEETLKVSFQGAEFETGKFALNKGDNPAIVVELLDKTLAARFGDQLLGEWPVEPQEKNAEPSLPVADVGQTPTVTKLPSDGPSPFEILTSNEWNWTDPVFINNFDVADDLDRHLTDDFVIWFDVTRHLPSLVTEPKEQNDIWFLTRNPGDRRWGPPVRLGAAINSKRDDSSPALSADGKLMVFTSDRPGGQGAGDIWQSERAAVDQPWSPAVNAGPAVNSRKWDWSPTLSPDGLELYFASGRGGDKGDIWVSRRKSRTATWGRAENVSHAVNSPNLDMGPQLSQDGRVMFFISENRSGSRGAFDIWMTSRASVIDPWPEPSRLPDPVNTAGQEFPSAVSTDGTLLLFRRIPEGGEDADGHGYWVTRRVRRGTANESTPSPAAPPATTVEDGWGDVIPLINPARDKYDFAWTGANKWVVRNGELSIQPDGKAAKMLFPLVLDGPSLEWEISFTRTSGEKQFTTDIPSIRGGVPISVGWGTDQVLMGPDPSQKENISLGRCIVRNGQRTTVRIRVERENGQDQVEVFVDGESIGEWTGDRETISNVPQADETYRTEQRTGLYVGPRTAYTFHSIRLRMLGGSALQLPQNATGDVAWSQPETLNLNEPLATSLTTLVHHTGSPPERDLTMWTRTSSDADWIGSAAVNPINTAADEASPCVSADGLTLVFESDRPGGFGQGDLWISTRMSAVAPWSAPVNLGENVNSPQAEGLATLSADGRTLIFASNRQAGQNGGGGNSKSDLWMSERSSSISSDWAPAVNLRPAINSDDRELAPLLSPDGLELFFTSDRPGGRGKADLWVPHRAAVGEPWLNATNLGPSVNGSGWDYGHLLSPDGNTLLFSSDRPGSRTAKDQPELWVTRRGATASTNVGERTTVNWTDLFNGRDLSGWTEFASKNAWRVRNGVITCLNGQGWLATDGEFSDFELTLEFRLPKGANSGILLRIPDEGNSYGDEFAEVQLFDDSTPRMPAYFRTGSVYGVAAASPSTEGPSRQWQSMRIVAVGPEINVLVNGREVNRVNMTTATAPEPPKYLHRRKGRIGLQRHASANGVEFRNLRIRDLSSSPNAN